MTHDIPIRYDKLMKWWSTRRFYDTLGDESVRRMFCREVGAITRWGSTGGRHYSAHRRSAPSVTDARTVRTRLYLWVDGLSLAWVGESDWLPLPSMLASYFPDLIQV